MNPLGANILIVDDEADILNLLGYNLKKAGFKVIEAHDGPEAIELAREKKPDLIVLDIMLPNMEGTEVLKKLKQDELTANIPVVMLTAKGEEIDRVLGLELGAEDYITKPFSPRELVLRVRAILKRKSAVHPPHGILAYKGLTVDPSRHTVSVSGAPVFLTAIEFGLLKTLFEAKGRVLTRDALLDRVWSESYVTPRTVDTHIRRLRAKLKRAAGYIETIRGVGYRFAEE